MKRGCCLLLLLILDAAQAADKPAVAPLAVEVRLQTKKKDARGEKRKMYFLGRAKDGGVICQAAGGGAAVNLRPELFARVRFPLNYDKKQAAILRRQGNWTGMAMVTGRAVAPTLKYLDLPHNNGCGLAMRTAGYLMRSGNIKSQFATDPAKRQVAAGEFNAAHQIFMAVGRASWSERSTEAQLQSCICLVSLGKIKEASTLLEEIGEPEVDDDEYGIYQLARAYYFAAQKDWQKAIEAAVHSSDFATKDIATFPTALLLAGSCYEELEEWYRARDVYYEVAKLFGQTPWAYVARQRLKKILDDKRTAVDEAVAAKNVFFGNNEDINAKARTLLGLDKKTDDKTKAAQPAKTDDKTKAAQPAKNEQ